MLERTIDNLAADLEGIIEFGHLESLKITLYYTLSLFNYFKIFKIKYHFFL